MEKKLICRSCQGSHLTLKCPYRNKKKIKSSKVIPINDKIYKLKISNLPSDIHVQELNTLVSPWGKIGKINIKKYEDETFSIIEFYNLNEAEYFVKALDNTGFDHHLIRVKIVNLD